MDGNEWRTRRSITKHRLGDAIHCDAVVVGFEEMAVAIHRHLQAAMTRKRLHGLGSEPRFDPA